MGGATATLQYGSWLKDVQHLRLAVLNGAGALVAELSASVLVSWPLACSDAAVLSQLRAPLVRSPTVWGGVPVGHRGFGTSARRLGVAENTLLAFDVGHRAGVQWVEFDVQLLKDNTPVLYHDVDVPLAPGTIKTTIGQLSRPELAALAPGQLRAGRYRRSGSDPRIDLVPLHSRAPVSVHDAFPLLQRVLAEVATAVGFNLEVKYAELPGALPVCAVRAT